MGSGQYLKGTSLVMPILVLKMDYLQVGNLGKQKCVRLKQCCFTQCHLASLTRCANIMQCVTSPYLNRKPRH